VLSLLDGAAEQGARPEIACGVLGISLRTAERWRRRPKDLRAGPSNGPPHQLSAAEKDEIVRLANQPAYRNLSPEQVVAKLAAEGIYVCSERSLRRVLAERKLDRHRQRSKPATSRHKPREYVASEPLRVLSWDITYLKNATVRGSYFFLYLFMDIWSRRIVAAQVHEVQSTELAADLLVDLSETHQLDTEKVVLHADNGPPMKGSTMLATLHALGITASFSRPSVSDDNAFVESLFRHLKYAPSYPRHGFLSLQDARDWVKRFVRWYNTEHLHSAIGLVTPEERHQGRDIAILEARRETYAAARQRNPRRWSRQPRAWHRPTIVTLNPDRVVLASPKSHAA
jgi:transposase InsO family protein